MHLSARQTYFAQDFLKNNRGINDGADLPEAYMLEIYDRIINDEIKMKVCTLAEKQRFSACNASVEMAQPPNSFIWYEGVPMMRSKDMVLRFSSACHMFSLVVMCFAQ